MKFPLRILSALCLLCTVPATAQAPVTLTFSNPIEQESQTIRSIAQLQQICVLENTITGPISGRHYTLEMVRSLDGIEERIPLGEYACASDTLRFHIASQPAGADSVQFTIPTPTGVACKHAIGDAPQCILMETYPEGSLTTDDTIPVMAFSPGETLEFPLPDGRIVRGMHYCSVRDGHLAPARWHERFGLQDYIWFELHFIDTPPR